FTCGTINSDLIAYITRLIGFKVKLVGQDKLVQVLKNMEHPFYEKRLVEQRQQEAVKSKTYVAGEKKLLQMFIDKPVLVKKYFLVSVTLILLSLLMSNWLKLFYLTLAVINLALAMYTYYRHLPNIEEEQVAVDDLW
ncbi:MAG: hypothetical protein O2U61_07520, partial [Candidatus Bathyarchaeota archaeon]|nr:hypothetical protein [Candidatus Bathyarchaeota archaeon]